MKRADDYETRRIHIAGLSDAELADRFWTLAGQLADPLLKLGYENTTPSIERSVLLRMGFSSLEANAIADSCIERNLIGHGAGNVVFRLSRQKGMSIRGAGEALLRGELWEDAQELFARGKGHE